MFRGRQALPPPKITYSVSMHIADEYRARSGHGDSLRKALHQLLRQVIANGTVDERQHLGHCLAEIAANAPVEASRAFLATGEPMELIPDDEAPE